MSGDNFSAAWCKPVGLIQVVGREGECVSAALKRDIT